MEVRVQSVERAAPRAGAGPSHHNRLVIPPADFAATSPFLLLAEDWFAPPAGFPTHPHRGMETVTFVLEGALAHQDHTGGASTLSAGDVQWMTAGRGVLHSELPGPQGVHSLQLWLNLPAALKGSRARYLDQRLADTPELTGDGVSIRVYAGRQGAVSHPFGSTWPITLLDIRIAAGRRHPLEIAAGQRGFLYVLDGSATLGSAGRRLRPEDVAWLEPATAGSILPLEAADDFRALFYAGTPIEEPVVARGPFVMNTVEEIARAYADFRAGTFV